MAGLDARRGAGFQPAALPISGQQAQAEDGRPGLCRVGGLKIRVTCLCQAEHGRQAGDAEVSATASPRRLPPERCDAPAANSEGAVSRVLSAPPGGGGEAHFSERPYPGSAPGWRRAARATLWIPYLALHPMGFSVPRRLRAGRWALTPPFHPCQPSRRTAGGLFSVALSVGRASRPGRPRVLPGRSPGLRGIAPCGARTFLPRRTGSEPPPLRSSWKRYRSGAARQGRKGPVRQRGGSSRR